MKNKWFHEGIHKTFFINLQKSTRITSRRYSIDRNNNSTKLEIGFALSYIDEATLNIEAIDIRIKRG